MKITILFTALLLAFALLFSCNTDTGIPADTLPSNAVTVDYAGKTPDTGEAAALSDPANDAKLPEGDFIITKKDGTEIQPASGVYKIKEEGEYTLSGNLPEGCVTVEADENAKIKLLFDGASVTSSTTAPIYIKTASSVDIESAPGSYNTVTDNRAASEESDGEDLPNGAIYAECDLKISGSGTLIVTAEHDNGIKTKDDLVIKDVTLKVTAYGNALKGNDSVTVKSGEIILISKTGDGVKTKNTDISEKGSQRGTVAIEGGKLEIYAKCDGIDASYDVNVSGECSLRIYTADYSEHSGEAEASEELYLIVPRNTYKTTFDYYAYFYNVGEDGGKFVKLEYETMVSSGRSQYYGLACKIPSRYQSVIFGTVSSGAAPDGENWIARTDGENVNTAMNGYLIRSVSSSAISGDWVTLTKGSGNSSKTAYSSKGVKAGNAISVNEGNIIIKCKDDGFHANADAALDNGEKAAGNITINGGNITVTAADDGMHADGELTVNDGYINVAESHEGLEANVINIVGGTVFVYGGDDGLNAFKGGKAAMINIYGGYLDVTTPSGDTDGIDSNGSIKMTGGFVLVKSGAQSGGMAGSVDCDGTVTVTGGAIVAFGGVCETPGSGSVNTYISSGTSFSSGSYVLTGKNGAEVLSFTLSSSYSSVWIASDAIELNSDYSLVRDGSEILKWTQTSQTVGKSGGGWGPGGHGGRPR